MKSFISICVIVILFLFTPSCTIRQFVPERKDFDAIYGGQNLVPNGDIEILDNGQPVGCSILGDVHKIINFLDWERCLEDLVNGVNSLVSESGPISLTEFFSQKKPEKKGDGSIFRDKGEKKTRLLFG